MIPSQVPNNNTRVNKREARKSLRKRLAAALLTLAIVSGLTLTVTSIVRVSQQNQAQAEGGGTTPLPHPCEVNPKLCDDAPSGNGGMTPLPDPCKVNPSACEPPKPNPDPKPTPPEPQTIYKLDVTKACLTQSVLNKAIALGYYPAGTKAACDDKGNIITNSPKIYFAVEVANTGNQTLRNVVLEDAITNEKYLTVLNTMTDIRISSGTPTIIPAQKKWNLFYTQLNPGQVQRLFYAVDVQYTSDKDVLQGLTNTVTAYSNDRKDVRDTASVTVGVVNPRVFNPDLAVIKLCNFNGKPCKDQPIPRGSVVEYVVSYTNIGLGATQLIGLVDDYDQTKMEFVSANKQPTFNTSNGTLTWSGQALSNNQINGVIYKMKVKNDVPFESEVTNSVRVITNNEPNSLLGNNTAVYTFRTAARQAPEVAIAKSCAVDGRACNAAPVVNGKRVTYTLSLKNQGNADASSVVVVDDYDQAHLKDLGSFSMSQTTNNDKITFNIGTIKVGESITITYQGTVSTTQAVEIKNTAVATVPEDMNLNNNTATYSFTTPAPAAPGIAIEKTCRVGALPTSAVCDKVAPGSTVYYTLTVRNTGNVALANTFAKDVYEGSKVSYIAGSVQGTGVLEQDTFQNGLSFIRFGEFNLDVGATKVITYAMRVNNSLTNGTIVTNKAFARSGDTVTKEVESRFTIIAVQPGSPSVTIEIRCLDKEAENFGDYKEDCGDFRKQDSVFYAIRVRNNGTVVANGLSIPTLAISPEIVENLTISFPATRATLEPNTEWVIKGKGTISNSVPVAAITDVSNTVTINYTNPGLGNGSSDTAVFHVVQDVQDKSVTIEKSCVVASTTTSCKDANSGLKAGSVVTYTLTVRNTGKDTLNDVDIVDEYDVKIEAITNLISGAEWNGTKKIITWDNTGSLASGASKTFTYNAKLGPAATTGAIIKNTATVKADDQSSSTVYEFRIPGPVTITPELPRTGAGDVLLATIMILSLGAGAYLYLNPGKVARTFGGARSTRV